MAVLSEKSGGQIMLPIARPRRHRLAILALDSDYYIIHDLNVSHATSSTYNHGPRDDIPRKPRTDHAQLAWLRTEKWRAPSVAGGDVPPVVPG
ncbi:hypothetical protein PsYK624_127050 [Phanerochaete sordida]|uniref:Uncharacterized protein n=1 Tax=Phanerochaete sordida TaxID=48140 RepID=A0A9P3LIT3_9APHY|nr:hypothetical protein PsYK624_127050 [Phanerochaete sordida]